jgi:hypothetical protein
VQVTAQDVAGNVSAPSGVGTTVVNTTPPVVTFYGTTGSTYSTASSLPATFTASDSVLTSLKYALYKDNTSSTLPTSGQLTTAWSGAATSTVTTWTLTVPLGQWDIEVVAADAAGNVTTSTTGNHYWTDNAAPVTSYTPTANDGGNGTWVGNELLTFKVSDVATPGVVTHFVWSGGASPWDGLSPVTGSPGAPGTTHVPSTTGTYTLQYYSVNGAGTTETPSNVATFVVNTTQPLLTGAFTPSSPNGGSSGL